MSNDIQTEIPGIPEEKTQPEILPKKASKKKTKKKRVTKRATGRQPFTNKQKLQSLENRLGNLRAEMRKHINELKTENSILNERIDVLNERIDRKSDYTSKKVYAQNKDGDWGQLDNNIYWKVIAGASTALTIWFAYLYFV